MEKDPSVIRGGLIEKAAGNAAYKGARFWHDYIAPSDLSAESGENGDISSFLTALPFSGCYKSFGHYAHFPLAFWCPSCRLEHCCEAQCVSGKVVLAFSA